MRDSTKKIISNAQVRVALVSPRAVTKVNCRLGPGLVPKISCPPRLSRRARRYCCGVIVPSQLASAAMLTRTTASVNEQNERTPVLFGATGFPYVR